MSPLVVGATALVALLNFRLLGGSRLVPIIRAAGLQGALVAGMAVVLRAEEHAFGTAALAAGSAAIKGLVLPALLLRALRQVEIRREIEPLVGYNLSLLLGAATLGVAALVGARISQSVLADARLLASVSFFTMATGLFLMISRRKAITQALGYLVFENGIYAFGVSLAHDEPFLVELGVLLDLLVAVFVMGIIIFHIQRDFAHIDVDRLAPLREPREPRRSRRSGGE